MIGKYCRKTHRSYVMMVGLLVHDNHLTLAHSRWGENGCILCRRAEKFGDSKLCSTCETTMKNVAPVLVYVPEDNEAYNDGS